MNIEERIERLERLEKLRINHKRLLEFGWDEKIVARELAFEKDTSIKELKEKIEDEISTIEYEF